MVSDYQLDQYCQFVKDMLLEDIISEPLIHSAYYDNQLLHTIQGLDKVIQLCTIVHDNILLYYIAYAIAYAVGLYYLKSVRCTCRLVPCYARAGHINVLCISNGRKCHKTAG